MSAKTMGKRLLGWGHIPLFSAVFIAVFFVSWEFMEAKFLSDVQIETKKWLYIGRGVFGAGCIGIITSILIRRHERGLAQMRQALVRHEKLAVVGQMAAGLAHEIGNPLASISSVAQILQRDSQSEEQVHRLKLIGKEIDRINKIVRQLVDFSRPERGNAMLLDVAAVLDEAVEIARYDPRSGNLQFNRTYASNLPPIRAVREHLLQVFLNIIYNAMDAMNKGGVLTIRLDCHGEDLLIDFKDTGVGIDSDNLERVFDPFFTTKGPGRGTGLGLAVTRHLVSQHNGRISLDSKRGVGTSIRITLPSINFNDDPSPASGRSAASEKNTGSMADA